MTFRDCGSIERIGAVVGGEVGSEGVRFCCCIGPVCRLRGNAVICFHMHSQTDKAEYSVSGGDVIYRWWSNLSVKEAEAKIEVGGNCGEV